MQERLDQRAVAGCIARAQPGRVGALRQAAEHDEARIAVASAGLRGAERAERRLRLVEMDLRIAFVGRDDEAVSIGQLERLAPFGERHHAAGRVVGRADVEQLRARPDVGGHRVPAMREAASASAFTQIRLRAGEQRRTFVDLIERIGNDDGRAGAAAVDHRLRRMRTALRGCRAPAAPASPASSARKRVATHEPAGDRLAQRGCARRRGIIRESRRGAVRERIENESRRRMFRLADREVDRRLRGIRRDVRVSARSRSNG